MSSVDYLYVNAVAAKAGTVEAILDRALGSDIDAKSIATALQTLKLLLSADATRTTFCQADGGKCVVDTARQHSGAPLALVDQ